MACNFCGLSCISFIVVVIAIVVGGYVYFRKEESLPGSLRQDHYWGSKTLKPGEPIPADNVQLKKFEVKVDEADLVDLKARLANTRMTQSFAGTNFEYGFHSDTLKKVIDYWTNKFDWRKQEKILNTYQHYKAQIEGLDIHFVHVKPTKPAKQRLPLLLVHGWPGSVWEFYKMIPMLTEPVDDVAFELIIPSIPGYGWSEAAHKRGMNTIHVARIFHKLMQRLGHQQFYYHGGDFGAPIGKGVAQLFPGRVLGLHTTMPMYKYTPSTILKTLVAYFLPGRVFDNPDVDVKKVFPLTGKFFYLLKETGYAHIHATKPDTVGAALNDSPAGLAAYILEKFSTWVNAAYIDTPDGSLTAKFTYDELLTNVMIYWTTNSITTSQRFYKESLYHMKAETNADKVPIPNSVPVGVAMFPNEIVQSPRTMLEEAYPNLVQYTDMPRGGHFAAFEEPQLVANDIRSLVSIINAKTNDSK